MVPEAGRSEAGPLTATEVFITTSGGSRVQVLLWVSAKTHGSIRSGTAER
jgi:hypothetical protein